MSDGDVSAFVDEMMAVPLRTDPAFSAGNPEVLFRGSHLGVSSGLPARFYDVSPDGKRFLMIQRAGGGETLHVVLNWDEELKARVPRDRP